MVEMEYCLPFSMLCIIEGHDMGPCPFEKFRHYFSMFSATTGHTIFIKVSMKTSEFMFSLMNVMFPAVYIIRST